MTSTPPATHAPSQTPTLSASSISELPSPPLLKPTLDAPPPSRKIFSEPDLAYWKESDAYHYLELMIARLSVAVEGKTVDDQCHESEVVKSLVTFLREMEEWIDAIPLQTSPQRFGNKAFRDWIIQMEEAERAFQSSILPSELHPAVAELSGQFRSSFGSSPRLDYGTGHELSFLAYLTILRLIGVFKAQDEEAMVLRVFATYLKLARKLQKVFRLEPAGSKGVWGLDDHQHLSYLWGASQLRTHPSSRPAAILQPASQTPHGMSNLFLSSILHLNDVKRGPFSEHSPILYNIATTVPNWAKVSTGLMRMYREEVLGKLPVVQHFRFGPILSWTKVDSNGTVMPSTGDGREEDQGEEHTDLNLRERDDGTVAPWALPSLSGTTPPPLQAVRIPSASGGTSSASASQPGRQTFNPPELFARPERRASRLSVSSGEGIPFKPSTGSPKGSFSIENTRSTVGSDGGAAAGSSPFGALEKATLGQGRGGAGGKKVPWEEVESKDGR